MKIVCCIVAGGQGTRLGDEWVKTPKALVPILGRPMLYYSLNAFDKSGIIDRFVAAIPSQNTDEFESNVKMWGFSRQVDLVPVG